MTYIDKNLKGTNSISKAAVFNITYLGNNEGYTIKDISSSRFFSIANLESIIINDSPAHWNVYSVTKKTDSGTGFSP